MLLHGAMGVMIEFVTAPLVSPNQKTEEERIVFVDSGSNINFILEDVATRMGPKGYATPLFMKVINEGFK